MLVLTDLSACDKIQYESTDGHVIIESHVIANFCVGLYFDLVVSHYSDVIMCATASQITGVPIIVCSIVGSGVDKKKNIKAPRHRPLWGEFTGDR